jgi:hypothetical protein
METGERACGGESCVSASGNFSADKSCVPASGNFSVADALSGVMLLGRGPGIQLVSASPTDSVSMVLNKKMAVRSIRELSGC